MKTKKIGENTVGTIQVTHHVWPEMIVCAIVELQYMSNKITKSSVEEQIRRDLYDKGSGCYNDHDETFGSGDCYNELYANARLLAKELFPEFFKN